MMEAAEEQQDPHKTPATVNPSPTNPSPTNSSPTNSPPTNSSPTEEENKWTYGKTKALIQIWLDNIEELQSAKRRKKERVVYIKIASSLEEMAISKTWNDVRNKIRNLSSQYGREVKKMRRGLPSKWTYFEPLRPVFKKAGSGLVEKKTREDRPIKKEKVVVKQKYNNSLTDEKIALKHNMLGDHEEIASLKWRGNRSHADEELLEEEEEEGRYNTILSEDIIMEEDKLKNVEDAVSDKDKFKCLMELMKIKIKNQQLFYEMRKMEIDERQKMREHKLLMLEQQIMERDKEREERRQLMEERLEQREKEMQERKKLREKELEETRKLKEREWEEKKILLNMELEAMAKIENKKIEALTLLKGKSVICKTIKKPT